MVLSQLSTPANSLPVHSGMDIVNGITHIICRFIHVIYTQKKDNGNTQNLVLNLVEHTMFDIEELQIFIKMH